MRTDPRGGICSFCSELCLCDRAINISFMITVEQQAKPVAWVESYTVPIPVFMEISVLISTDQIKHRLCIGMCSSDVFLLICPQHFIRRFADQRRCLV